MAQGLATFAIFAVPFLIFLHFASRDPKRPPGAGMETSTKPEGSETGAQKPADPW